MSELAPSAPIETNEHESPDVTLDDTLQNLPPEEGEVGEDTNTAETSLENGEEKISSQETARMIEDYKAEHGSVRGLSMTDLVERGFDPDMTLRKIGNERLEEKLDIVSQGRVERGTEQWARLEENEARYVPVSDEEIDALIEAGANPQYIVDALQRTEPEDGVDNPSSARIAARLDKLVEAGLPPAILAARLNPSWREAMKDKLADAENKWREANRLKAVA